MSGAYITKAELKEFQAKRMKYYTNSILFVIASLIFLGLTIWFCDIGLKIASIGSCEDYYNYLIYVESGVVALALFFLMATIITFILWANQGEAPELK